MWPAVLTTSRIKEWAELVPDGVVVDPLAMSHVKTEHPTTGVTLHVKWLLPIVSEANVVIVEVIEEVIEVISLISCHNLHVNIQLAVIVSTLQPPLYSSASMKAVRLRHLGVSL